MQTSREEFHKFIDQVPPTQLTSDVLAYLKELIGALTDDRPGRKSAQTRKSAQDLLTALVWMREFDLGTPAIRAHLASLHDTVVQLAATEAELEYRLAFENAPEDDEEETEEELAEVAAAREDVLAGRTRPWEDVLLELEAKADRP